MGLAGLLLAVLSLIVALVALVRARPIQDLQKRLAEIELRSKTQAALTVRIVKAAEHQYKWLIENRGHATAYEVNLEPIGDTPTAAFIPEDVKRVLPVKSLPPEQTANLHARLAKGLWPPFEVRLRWKDQEDGQHSLELTVPEPF